MRAMRGAPLAVPPFLQVPLKLFKAVGDEERVRLSYLCVCGEQPNQVYRCPKDGNEYTVKTMPLKGYKMGREVVPVGTPEEVEAAKASGPSYDTLEVQAIVDLKRLTLRYTFGDAYYVLPDPDENALTFRQYALFLRALDAAGWAMLCRLSVSSVPRRFAVVPDLTRAVLVAHELKELRELPYDLTLPATVEKEFEQLRAILQAQVREDVTFPADADPLEGFVAAKVKAFREKAEKAQGAAWEATLAQAEAKAGEPSA